MFENGTYRPFPARIKNIIPFFEETTNQLKPVSVKSLENIIAGARNSAPYLDDLCAQWPNVLLDLQTKAPEEIYKALIANISNSDFQTPDFKTLCAALRNVKRQVHLLCAICDIAGVWNWEIVTAVLSDFADMTMRELMVVLALDMGFEGDEYGPVPGLFVLALGKYGGRELNYSSDIDLIVFYDPDHIKLPDPNKAQRILVRFVQKLMRGFDENLPEGYIFRTDLRLRPDPRSNAVAVSTTTAERYYETLGQNWERAAMIKARFCGGDKRAADTFYKNVLEPFIWRRSLDYAAIADIHAIKRQIQGRATLAQMQARGHDVKLGLGGIREIEFYTQVQQLILGGRNKGLRTPRTVDALQKLAEGDYADNEIIADMQKDYGVLRDIEHRIQMHADAQTHIWPEQENIRLQLTALSAQENLESFEAAMTERFAQIHTRYTQLFPDEDDLSTTRGSLVFTGVEAEAETLATLEAYGFTRGPRVWKLMSDWLGGRIRATRTPRARELLTRLAPRIIEACGATGTADEAFMSFADFMTNLNAGVTLLSLLLNKPETLFSLMNMLAIAPRLAHTLSQQPALLDAMVEPAFLSQTLHVSQHQYDDALDGDTDFETAMNVIRRLVHDDQFNLTASVLNQKNIGQAGAVFSKIAQSAIQALLPKAVQDIERLYGNLDGEFAILGMGKLGSAEMTLKSDVDLMLVYQCAGETLETPRLFNKLTRRLITALSGVTEEGALYEVDMALRPSGRSGPLAVSVEAFETYYRDRAWTWEYMALSRARVVAGSSEAFVQKMTGLMQTALVQKQYSGTLENDILDMHGRLARDKPPRGGWDIKGVEGGLRDIEFIAQYLILKHKPSDYEHDVNSMLVLAGREGWLADVDVQTLLTASRKYQILLQVIAIAVDGILVPKNAPASVTKLLAQSVGVDTFSILDLQYMQWRQQVASVFKRVLRVN